MDIKKARDIFEDLYLNVNGYQISKDSVTRLPYYYVANIYGEVLFDSFIQILKEAKVKDGDVFYDLGSGTGKPSLIAGLCFNFSKVIGVEKLKEVYLASEKALDKYKKKYSEWIKNKRVQSKIDFVNSDFKNIDFTEANVIFMNSSTLFHYEINSKEFSDKIIKLKKDSKLITTSMYLNSALFKIEQKGPYDFSWGKEYIYVHIKL